MQSVALRVPLCVVAASFLVVCGLLSVAPAQAQGPAETPSQYVLFVQCKHLLQFDFSAAQLYLDPAKPVKYETDNGTLLPHPTDSSKVYILPAKPGKTIVTAYQQGASSKTKVGISSRIYQAVPTPGPRLAFYVEDTLLPPVNVVLPPDGEIAIRLMPDSYFLEQAPTEARYSLQDITVEKLVNNQRILLPVKFNSEPSAEPEVVVALTGLQAQPFEWGDVLYIKVGRVVRVNSQGQSIIEPFNPTDLILKFKVQ